MTVSEHSSRPTLHATALALAERGYAVFPCQPRGKEPVTSHGCLDATTDPDRINGWWGAMADLNIGVATGAPSGFFAVDIDGEDGEGSLRKLETKHGELPPTIEVITGAGRHLWFRIRKHSDVRNSASQIAPGLDVRGSGGYVIAPPSVHPSGRAYCWSVDCARELADAPDWLHTLIRPIREDEPGAKGKPLEHWHRVLTREIHNGERNTTLTSICGKLLHFGVDDVYFLRDMVQCVNLARCAEPLSDEEVDTLVASVVRMHLRELRGER